MTQAPVWKDAADFAQDFALDWGMTTETRNDLAERVEIYAAALLTAATERAGRLQTALDAAATLAGVADEIRIDWKHGIYGAEPYERLSAALKAYDDARAALGGDAASEVTQ